MDVDIVRKTCPAPPRGCYRCGEPNHLVKDCPYRLRLSANTLDACGTSIILPIEIGTTDTSEVHSVKALLDSGATGNFIDKDFVRTKGISTRSISRPIPVFNIDGSPNEAGRISEVVDVVLRYKTHSERMLLAVVTPLEDFLRKCSMGYILYP